jgi:hypothetical protein
MPRRCKRPTVPPLLNGRSLPGSPCHHPHRLTGRRRRFARDRRAGRRARKVFGKRTRPAGAGEKAAARARRTRKAARAAGGRERALGVSGVHMGGLGVSAAHMGAGAASASATTLPVSE